MTAKNTKLLEMLVTVLIINCLYFYYSMGSCFYDQLEKWQVGRDYVGRGLYIL
jgi:hypothetical protein